MRDIIGSATARVDADPKNATREIAWLIRPGPPLLRKIIANESTPPSPSSLWSLQTVHVDPWLEEGDDIDDNYRETEIGACTTTPLRDYARSRSGLDSRN